MAIATSQITIIDYNDALSLTGFISSNKATTQIYNPDNGSFTPDWSVSPYVVLTPSLFIMGTSTDIIASNNVQSIEWYDATAPTTKLTASSTYGLSAFTAGQNRPLTIKQNILTGSTLSKDFIVEIVYKDPSTGLNLTYKTSISFGRITNGGGITNAIVTSPAGNIFKNGGGGTLTAKADLWRGNTIDSTSVTYQWYSQDASQATDVGGGVGWKKLDGTYNMGTTGYATNTLTIPNTAVANLQVFKCVVTDTDSLSNTYNQTFSGTIVFIDQTDPIQVSVTSSGGDVFKNGVGSSTLTAKVFQAGTEIDTTSPYKYTYKWYKYDKNGSLVTGWGGTGIDYKTGKTLSIGDPDVDTKATFAVEIS
ncbi:hypothetical protein V7094_26875 [Priestia megaterium]|uniref:hypothetical protein n=1 Tax=Priestia megaterium TaxID=1404 RepID=UPI002FFD69AD